MLRYGAFLSTANALVFSALLLLGVPFHDLRADQFVDDRITQIRAEVEQEQVAIRDLARQQKALEVDFKKQSAAAERVKLEEAALLADLEKVKASEIEVAKEIDRIGDEAAQLRETARGRLKAIYMQRSRGVSNQLFMRAGNTNFEKHAYYAARVHRHDLRIMKKMAALISEREQAREELGKVRKEKEQVAAALQSRRKKVVELVERQRRLAVTIQKNKEAREEKMLGLQAQALRLETVVSSLTGGPGESDYARRRRRSTSPGRATAGGVYQGPGLLNLKGALAVPVKGEVLSRYGKQSGKSFSDIVFKKGVEFAAPEGTKVVAVAKGRVLHLGRMPGYGTIVIIDHGKRYYSLYGRLGRTLVDKGVEVAKGTVIAQVSGSDEEKTGLHFEIRKDGKPVDPQGFYTGRL